MFSFMFIDNIGVEKPIITKYHYEITMKSKESEKQTIETDYELWDKNELAYISTVDLSTPLEDDEDYSKW